VTSAHRTAFLTVLFLATPAKEASAGGARVSILDDGEKIAREVARDLPPSAWPEPAEVELFAMRGETVAVQAVIDALEVRVREAHALMTPLRRDDGAELDPHIETFAEHFVEIRRPSGNEHEPGSLAFTAAAAPPPALYTGWLADPLVPGDTDVEAGQRGALWIDLTVPSDARPGLYRAVLHVSAVEGVLAERTVALRVLDHDLPFFAHKTMVYYDPVNLEQRMGDAGAESQLRRLLHAHHLSAIRDRRDARDLDLDLDALSGELFTKERGYDGAGEGVGEGVFALGAYGSLGAPTLESLHVAEEMALRLGSRRTSSLDLFLYAIDETCSSPWGAGWRALFARSSTMGGVRVGVTCGTDPLAQAADLVMMTSADYVPERARLARERGKRVWAYNGQRPYAGPLMLDAPATDLRANAWIAARYDVARWFYWESTYWLDNNRGGRGGPDGFDPFVTAETFHNADGDWANGDGILLYPGTQRARGMIDFGAAEVFGSVRLKNLRRGVEDAGYIELARAVDADATAAIVRRMIPRALAHAGARVAWPARGIPWLDARAELALVIDRAPTDRGPAARTPGSPAGCAQAPAPGIGAAWGPAAPGVVASVLAFLFALVRVRHRR
jgi:hypothetical protein